MPNSDAGPPNSYEEAHALAQPLNRYAPSNTFLGVPRASMTTRRAGTARRR